MSKLTILEQIRAKQVRQCLIDMGCEGAEDLTLETVALVAGILSILNKNRQIFDDLRARRN